MNKLFLLLFFGLQTLFGSIILSYNIYDRTDRVDIMFTFDTPYEGKIVKSQTSHQIILKLYDASIEAPKEKQINSSFITRIRILPFADHIQIIADIPNQNITLKASKTADAYGLRLRFTKQSLQQQAQTPLSQLTRQNSTPTQPTKALPTQKELTIPTSYYVVVTILIVLVIILFFMKNKMKRLQDNTLQKPKGKSWLFASLPEQKEKTPPSPAKEQLTQENVAIRFQKQLNENTSVIMLDFLNQSYLILLGTSNNILLDKFIENQPTTQNEFEALLQEKHTQLDQYLQLQQNESEQQESNSLKNFSQKASNIPLDNL